MTKTNNPRRSFKPSSLISLSMLAAVFATPVTVAETDSALPEILSRSSEVYLPDFSYAGYKNGLEPLPVFKGKVIEVSDTGAVADDGKDDSAAILKAIDQANQVSGPVIVRFEAGTYQVTEILRIERSNLVLQGAGSGKGGTTILFPRPLNQVDKSSSQDELRKYLSDENKFQRDPDQNVNELFSEYSWAGGFIWIQKPGTNPYSYLEESFVKPTALQQIESGERGDKSVTVKAADSISVGDVVQIHWFNREGPEGGIVKSLYGDEYKKAGSRHWSFPDRPVVAQTTKILAIDGTQVSIADPLLHDINAAIPAQISAWDHLTHVGIEDLHLEFPVSPAFGHHLERGYNGIYFTSAYDSWARGIRITNADSGILSYNSANLTYKDIVSEGVRKAHYAVHFGNVHNALAENITITNPVLHSLTFNTQSTKCVYKDAQVFTRATLDQHAGANHQNLYDNVTLYRSASDSKKGPVVPIYNGSGAPYWQPGHGAYNTSWNIKVLVQGGAYADEVVTLQGLDEGPLGNIIGLHGNRQFKLDYRPSPYVEKLNVELRSVPSLYAYQLARRLQARP